MQLLLIDPDLISAQWLSDRLAAAGFVMRTCASVAEAAAGGLAAGTYAVLVEAGSDQQQSVGMIQQLRRAGVEQPLLILSPRGDWREKIACLDAGADDYLVKPVRSEEIAARLRVLVRRSAGSATDRIVVGDIDLDLRARCAWRRGQCLGLTRNEFRLLRLFLLRPGQVIAHEELREQLYSEGSERSQNALEVQIARLRRKVGSERITTLRGSGYRFASEDPAAVRNDYVRQSCVRVPADEALSYEI